MGWSRRFDDPIPLPRGQLVTLREAANYIVKLPKTDQQLDHWQTAAAMLIGVAEGRDFLMHARIGMLRALNHGKPDPASAPRRKRAKTYKIIGKAGPDSKARRHPVGQRGPSSHRRYSFCRQR